MDSRFAAIECQPLGSELLITTVLSLSATVEARNMSKKGSIVNENLSLTKAKFAARKRDIRHDTTTAIFGDCCQSWRLAR